MSDDDDHLLEHLGDALSAPVPPLDDARVRRVSDAASDATTLASSTPSPEPTAPADPSRRRVLWMSAAAAAGGIAAGVAGAVLVTDDDGSPAVPTEDAGALTMASGVDAEAHLIDHGWGLEVLLDVSGLVPGARYAMTFFDRADVPVDAGGFVGTDGLMRCRNNGAVLRAEVARFEVTDTAGGVVVAADLA